MNLKELTKEICKREGLKKQVEIGNVREILGHLSDLFFEECGEQHAETYVVLVENGKKRAKRKGKKK